MGKALLHIMATISTREFLHGRLRTSYTDYSIRVITPIVIGVMTVIIISSVINGLNSKVSDLVASFGTNILWVTRLPFAQRPTPEQLLRKYLTQDDADAISHLPSLETDLRGISQSLVAPREGSLSFAHELHPTKSRARLAALASGTISRGPRMSTDAHLALADHLGTVVTREVLMRDVWDENWYGPTKTLDVHMANLRRKLAAAGADPGSITTLRGVGFRLERG